MSSIADTDFAAADELLAELFGVSLEYVRGEDSVTIAARCMGQGVDVNEAEGVYLDAGTRVYLVHAADLVLDGAVTKPARGDRIRETIGGAVRTFEVLPTSGDACYVEADPAGADLVVYAKETG